jgi:hypothetical protein
MNIEIKVANQLHKLSFEKVIYIHSSIREIFYIKYRLKSLAIKRKTKVILSLLSAPKINGHWRSRVLFNHSA